MREDHGLCIAHSAFNVPNAGPIRRTGAINGWMEQSVLRLLRCNVAGMTPSLKRRR